MIIDLLLRILFWALVLVVGVPIVMFLFCAGIELWRIILS